MSLDQFEYVFKKGTYRLLEKMDREIYLFKSAHQSISPDQGKIVIGDTVKFGYYTQNGITIKPGQKVIEVIREFGDYIPL